LRFHNAVCYFINKNLSLSQQDCINKSIEIIGVNHSVSNAFLVQIL